MSKIVSYNGQTIEFPDEMSDDAISAALRASAAPSASAPLGRLDKLGQGMVDPINGGAQLLTKMLPNSWVQAGNDVNNWLADKTGLVAKLPQGGVDQQVRDQETAYQARRDASGETGLDGWRITGNLLSPATLAIASRAPAAAGLLSRMGIGAAGGAVSGLLNPVTAGDDYAAEKAKQVAVGGLLGGAIPAVSSAISSVISPAASKAKDILLLKSEGVGPTIGQTLGGWANSVEQKLQSVPLFGDAITAARNRAREQFNTAALNRAGAPIGEQANGIGQDAVASMGDKISNAYNQAKAQLGSFQLDRQAAADLAQIQQMAGGLAPREKAAFDAVWSRLDDAVSPSGHVNADAFKMFDSKAGQTAAQFMGSPDVYQQQVGGAIKQLQQIVLDAAKRARPAAAADMDKADAAYANLVRVEGASKAAMNSGGIFTPAQLQQAVRAADQSVRDRATARGQALMQDLSGTGQRVLGNTVPDSGTAGRIALGGAAVASGAVNPLIPAGLLAGAGLYTPPAQALLRGLLTSRPAVADPIAKLLEQASPMLGTASGLLAPQVLKN